MGTGCSRLQQAQDDPLFLRKVNVKDMLGVAKVGIDTILLTDQLAKGLTTYTCNQRREKMDWAASQLGSGMLFSQVLWSMHGGESLEEVD